MGIFMKLKNIFKKKEEYEMPYERGAIVLTEKAIERNQNEDMQKWIFSFEGNELKKKTPYSKSAEKVLKELNHLPIHNATKKKKLFVEGEEVIPSEVYYEEV